MLKEGKWKYQSYRTEPGAGATPPTVVFWSPPGKGEVNIVSGGTTGVLKFTGTPIELALEIEDVAGDPEAVSITAKMKLPGNEYFTNVLLGWKIPDKLNTGNPDVVRGSILLTSNDIVPTNPQPIYTCGFFILEKL
ncbi:MAG: hypothetical protein NT069_35800 [Planctomycetota bacterium]|nr:hypothetical protein [Planctomycetota bacterium]